MTTSTPCGSSCRVTAVGSATSPRSPSSTCCGVASWREPPVRRRLAACRGVGRHRGAAPTRRRRRPLDPTGPVARHASVPGVGRCRRGDECPGRCTAPARRGRGRSGDGAAGGGRAAPAGGRAGLSGRRRGRRHPRPGSAAGGPAVPRPPHPGPDGGRAARGRPGIRPSRRVSRSTPSTWCPARWAATRRATRPWPPSRSPAERTLLRRRTATGRPGRRARRAPGGASWPWPRCRRRGRAPSRRR